MAKRLLDIVVTHYKEPFEVVRPMFDVLNSQLSADYSLFKIWIIQDGPCEDIFPKGYFNNFRIETEWVTIPHKGVSAARNTGIERADSEWICFCDCDDTFTSVYSLKMLADIFKNPLPYDFVWGPFCISWSDSKKGIVATQKTYNRIWIHNKYYRLSFLREKNICFPEWIHFSEDSAFNNILELEIQDERIGQINTENPIYAWVRRPGSVSNDPSRHYKNTMWHFERNLYVLDKYREQNHPKSDYILVRTIMDAWTMLTKYPPNDEFWKITKRVAEFWKKNQDIYEEFKKKTLQMSLFEAGTDDKIYPWKMSLEEWIECLKK